MRTKTGVVVSNKMNKTIVVSVDTMKRDSKYKKSYKVSTKFYAHDENNSCVTWETVVIKETRPLSKTKRWELLEKNA
jgi:small subunit ribosomal protein S17